MGLFDVFLSLQKKSGAVKKPVSDKFTAKIEVIDGITFKFKKHLFSKCIKMSVKQDTDCVLVTYPIRGSFKSAKLYALNNIGWAKDCFKDKKPPLDKNVIKQRRKMAKEYLPKRLFELSNLYGFKYNDVRLKNVRTRWGSCSIRNNINLNINLMALDDKLIDYVLVHELAHTVHKNHGENFWALVNSCIPDAKERRHMLKRARMF